MMRGVVLFLMAVLVVCFFYFDINQSLSLESVKAQQQLIVDYHATSPKLH